MLEGRALYHDHDHVHGHVLRHRHFHDEVPQASVDLSSHFVDGGASNSVENDYSLKLLARSGSDEKTGGPDINTVIAIGVAIPLVTVFIVLVFLHRRQTKRVAQEDMDDKYKSLDFGTGDTIPGGKKRRSAFFGKEKDSSMHKAQLSMDMNLSSPYLLPPDLQQSRESMNSLAKSLHKNEDPYRPVTEYTNSEIGSLRSFKKTGEKRTSSIYTNKTGAPGMPPSRQNSMPSPTGPLPQLPPAAQTPRRQEFEGAPAPLSTSKNEVRVEQVPTIQEPPAAASRISHVAITDTVRPLSGESMNGRDLTARGNRNDAVPTIQDNSEHFQGNAHDAYGQQTAPYPNDNRPPPAGLGVPGQNNRRLSVGFRPLPPDDFLDSEDPEFRANRIRSFYKEYFEDGKQDAARPPVPPVPQAGFREEYDQGYPGEAAYFDPDSNAFVMPYAAPVTRRAMTPPPSNRRPMPGPRQRGPPGPIPMPGAPGARPRAGSTSSAPRWNPMSPRPGSSASNPRSNSRLRAPMPPPADLNTLPTPSKLKDDSFAIFNAMDFAPPPSFKDQAAGRSQSPVGERVPYRSNTPVHSPLVSAFEETTPLPSPHLLRKSGAYTALDFAPPRRFKDPEVMSDAGSIRSNRSGLSSKNAVALRNGAGRVSRLPGDTVFTQADSLDTLKPQWGMRP